MKYCKFQVNGQAQYGLVESVAGRETIQRVLLTAPEESDGDVEGLRTRRIEAIALEEAELLAPVRPSKIVCVGRNYKAHAAELGNEVPKEPLLFFKPSSSLLGPGGVVRRPKTSERVDFEGELCVVMGKTCYKPAADEDVRPYILGYTCLNDITARDLQKKDGQWARAKGSDTFCPVGPLVTDEVDPSAGISITTRLNGELRQDGNTRDFIFSIDHLLRYITAAMTLFPGDLVLTGTPAGVAPMQPGDQVAVTVEGLGVLSNPVAG